MMLRARATSASTVSEDAASICDALRRAWSPISSAFRAARAIACSASSSMRESSAASTPLISSASSVMRASTESDAADRAADCRRRTASVSSSDWDTFDAVLPAISRITLDWPRSASMISLIFTAAAVAPSATDVTMT